MNDLELYSYLNFFGGQFAEILYSGAQADSDVSIPISLEDIKKIRDWAEREIQNATQPKETDD